MKILFQGDSITDAGRVYDNDLNIGRGYPHLIKASLGFEAPEKYEFLNRGINSSRIVDLYARIRSDIINLRPDVLSILIGVNGVWHNFWEKPNGVSEDKYFKIYDMLIEEIKDALPNIKIMILEPFVLKEWATQDHWEAFREEVEKRARMAKKIADKHDLAFVALQEGFDKFSQKAPVAYWLGDGVHPTTMGHEFIKKEWIKAFKVLVN